jgi:nicotinate-nucleotide pyrophosphorylase (carboxylating)
MEITLNRVAKTIIRRALNEDLGKRGDITSRATVPTDQTGEAVIIAKAPGVIAGQRIAAGVFAMLEKRMRYDPQVRDGDPVAPGAEIARIKGKTWVILAGERTALNILGRCSGIATRTTPTVSPLLPVVFMTALKLEDARKMIPPDPHIRLIGKPIDFEVLRAAIRELTGLDRPL